MQCYKKRREFFKICVGFLPESFSVQPLSSTRVDLLSKIDDLLSKIIGLLSKKKRGKVLLYYTFVSKPHNSFGARLLNTLIVKRERSLNERVCNRFPSLKEQRKLVRDQKVQKSILYFLTP